jgi:hypothetical protein
MRRYRTIAIFAIILFSVLPTLCWAVQFKITEVYDGTTVRAEGYDADCLP